MHTVKIDWLRELVESLDGEPLLIAYEFIEDLRAIRRAFGEVPALGGLTPARDAARLVAAWNVGKLPLLAFHPASAGHEINLQFGGSRIAWIAPSWSAELTEQSIARDDLAPARASPVRAVRVPGATTGGRIRREGFDADGDIIWVAAARIHH